MTSSCGKGCSDWILGRFFFAKSVIMHWNRPPREMGESLSLEVWYLGHSLVGKIGGRWMVEIDDLRGHFRP